MRSRALAVAFVLASAICAPATPARAGTLALTSTVPGVEAWVDDQRVGALRPDAALLVPNLPPGSHRIVAKKGARTWERAVPVADEGRTSVEVELALAGQEPTLKHLAEVVALVDAMYVVAPDFAEFRLGALRGLEKALPDGSLAVATTAEGTAMTYRGPPPGGNTRILFGPAPGREGTLHDLVFAAGLAREAAPVVPLAKSEQAMLQGALGALDAHSSFLDRDTYRDMQVEISGSFVGVGIELTRKDDALSVVAPIEGTPAQRAGIQTGDQIVGIDGTSAIGMTLPEAVRRIRGRAGTKVTLGILRQGWPAARDFELARERIRVHSVQGREIEPGVAYVRLRQFQERTADDLEAALGAWQNGALQGLVLDLRNNPGGLLTAAVAVAEKFIEPGRLVVYTQGRVKGQNVHFTANGKKVYLDVPMVVLVNGGSASASEIVAGALQDWRRAVLVGSRTFGKGSVQTIIPLSDGTGLRLTTARYYTPKGRSIDGTGLDPEDVVAAGVPAALGTATDPQLQRALAELRQRIATRGGH